MLQYMSKGTGKKGSTCERVCEGSKGEVLHWEIDKIWNQTPVF